jgi:hypothetical protein
VWVAILVLIGAAAILLWTLSDTHTPPKLSGPPGHPPPAPVSPTPPAAQQHLESVPSGAKVFEAEGGQELGQTPLFVDLGDAQLRQVILRLPGFHTETVTLERGVSRRTVLLIAETAAADEAVTPRSKTSREIKKRTHRRSDKPSFEPKRADETLLDPF